MLRKHISKPVKVKEISINNYTRYSLGMNGGDDTSECYNSKHDGNSLYLELRFTIW
jgi:hypothetical protein